MLKIAVSMGQIYLNKRNETRDFIDNKLILFLKKCFSCQIFLISNISNNSKKNILDLKQYLIKNRINFIVLSGGTNVGENKLRDLTENILLKYALNNRIKLLGICRGMQFINLYFKGKLKKIKEHVGRKKKIYSLEGKQTRIVKCYHNYGIQSLGNSLKKIYKSSDGEIESILHINKRILGIMWHPERSKNFHNDDLRLIKNFIKKNQ